MALDAENPPVAGGEGAPGQSRAKPPVTPPTRASLVIVGAVLAFAVAYAFACVIGKNYKDVFFAMPFVPGFIVGAASLRHPYRNGFIALAIGLGAAVATLREGAACVVMALPILIPVCLVGVFMGSVVRRYLHTRKARVVASLVVLTAQMAGQAWQTYADDPRRHPWHVVRNEVAVQAPPAKVFATLVGGELKLAGPWPTVLSVGLPIPRSMRVETPGLGGSVRFDFNHGTAWGEIVEWSEGRAFAFEIKRYELRDPLFFHTRLDGDDHFGLKQERVTDWLTFGTLGYHIEPRTGGGATLTRTTTYQRHLFPTFYFAWLEATVVRLGGDRLMAQLKAHAEAPALTVSAASPR